jgi:hypothetical protein
MERSKREFSDGIGTVLPVELAVREMKNSVRSVHASISAVVGCREAAAGRAVENPIQQFSFGMRVDIGAP